MSGARLRLLTFWIPVVLSETTGVMPLPRVDAPAYSLLYRILGSTTAYNASIRRALREYKADEKSTTPCKSG